MYVSAGGRQPANPLCRKTSFKVRFLIVAVIVALAGCASPEPHPDPTPAVQVPESTWRQVDADIDAASLTAKGVAWAYAHGFMESWMSRVRQHTAHIAANFFELRA